MIKCPSCDHAFDSATASGIVARGQATVSFNERNEPEITSPIKVTWCVKQGRTIKKDTFFVICPYCGITLPVSDFAFVRQSMLSNKNAARTIHIGTMDIHVADDAEEALATLLLPYITTLFDRLHDDETVKSIMLSYKKG